MKNLKVSVLIANYNNQKYIEECIGSIKNQTYQNIEIIFHDDSSSDNSIKYVNKLKNIKNIKIIKNKKKTKVGSYNQINAYQRAFGKSTGDIIFFLDSDDFFHKDKIKKIIEIFTKDKKLISIFDLPILKYNEKLSYKKDKKKFVKNFWPYIPPQSCISIRRKDFKEMINSINFFLFPDIWMDFRIALYLNYIKNNFFVLNKNLTYYRQTKNNISSNFSYCSLNWWKRRLQAHRFTKFFLLKNDIFYKKNFDYYLTRLVNLFIK